MFPKFSKILVWCFRWTRIVLLLIKVVARVHHMLAKIIQSHQLKLSENGSVFYFLSLTSGFDR